jgi:hypothetical protein
MYGSSSSCGVVNIHLLDTGETEKLRSLKKLLLHRGFLHPSKVNKVRVERYQFLGVFKEERPVSFKGSLSGEEGVQVMKPWCNELIKELDCTFIGWSVGGWARVS